MPEPTLTELKDLLAITRQRLLNTNRRIRMEKVDQVELFTKALALDKRIKALQ